MFEIVLVVVFLAASACVLLRLLLRFFVGVVLQSFDPPATQLLQERALECAMPFPGRCLRWSLSRVEERVEVSGEG